MGKLTSMAYTKAELKERDSPKAMPCDSYMGSKYPYGLCINLESAAIEKLGLESLPKAGATMTLTATVVVKSVSLNERQDGKDEKRLELQIERMALDNESGAVSALEKGLQDAEDE